VLTLKKWFSNSNISKMVTNVSAEIRSLVCLRNAYIGKLGVVEEGALADLMLMGGKR